MNTFKNVLCSVHFPVYLGILLISSVFLINWNHTENKPVESRTSIPTETSLNIDFQQNNHPFCIQISGDPKREMQGEFRNSNLRGRIVTSTELYEKRRETVDVRQTWILHPPEPIKSVKLHLSGTMNLNNNSVILTGRIASDGKYFKKNTEAKIKGTFQRYQGGMSMGGELMFNPQPEPPAKGE
ncbi:MAG: hypothetical protein GVY20_07075 [Bacteroidetes bacterium]|jgi:hypothetical protein|nr:hypothetical protein [Bacteroidota bacterium]